MQRAGAAGGGTRGQSRRTRRDALAIAAGYAMVGLLGAQPSRKPARVGFVGPPVPDAGGRELFSSLRVEMERLGWAEGRRVSYVLRLPGEIVTRDLTSARVAMMAQELAAAKVELIVAMSTGCARAAKAATTTIPIVFLAENPVENGLVASLARPGSNATGVTYHINSLAAKRMQLLTQAAPGVRRIAYLGIDDELYRTAQFAAKALDVEVLLARVDRADQLEHAFSDTSRADAWIVEGHATLAPKMNQIVELIAKSKKPAIYGSREWVEAGGLMAYSDDRVNWPRHVASLVDRVLHGAKPADLPVLEPTRFQLVINRKTARALGLTVPQSLMLQADEILE